MIRLTVFALAAVCSLAACGDPPAPAEPAQSAPATTMAIPPPNPPPGDALKPPELSTPSTPASVPAASATPIDPVEIQARQAKAYIDHAKQQADQRLLMAEHACDRATGGNRDDCIAVATAAHESEMAAARLEYEARLRPQEAPGG